MLGHMKQTPSAPLFLGFLSALTLWSIAPNAASAAPLPRSHIVLPNAISVDPDAGTVTLPLHSGHAGSKTVWYIVTDSSDKADAAKRGAIYAPLLAGAGAGCADCVLPATESNGVIAFPGAPNFEPKRVFKPGPTGFPPAAAAPGGTAGKTYSPFLKINGIVINAPIVATGSAPFDVTTHRNTEDRVVAIDTEKHTVTLALAKGFSGGKHIVYISTEASDPGAAAIERATYVPSLKATGGFVPIDVVANGSHQGLGFVALKGNLDLDATAANAASLGSSMNVLSTFPTGAAAQAYSPLWNVTVLAWKPAVSAAHKDVVLTSLADVGAHDADLTGPGGKPVGPVGFVVNCPVVGFVDGAP
jgi:hypothetical protein